MSEKSGRESLSTSEIDKSPVTTSRNELTGLTVSRDNHEVQQSRYTLILFSFPSL